jgi:aldose 1-epimerase
MRTLLKCGAVVLLAAILTTSCASKNKTVAARKITSQPFGKTTDGIQVDLYTLTNVKGAEATISTYGGAIVSLKVPDRKGVMADVVLGFDKFEDYLKPQPYFGAIIGRYANRIAHGKFTLSGVEYMLAKNDGDNALHGGIRGFDKRLWTAREGSLQSLELNYTSADGEEGYRGALSVTVTYNLTDNNELQIDYAATTDKATVLNLTNHSYFNLAGQGVGDILSHKVTIYASKFTPVDKGLIPTGELKSVLNTPFDFQQAHAIGERIDAKDEQLAFGGGYDHNFVLNSGGASLEIVAKVTEPESGRVMEVLTTEPGLQFYTGNHLDGTLTGKGGKKYGLRAAFCMETQHFPDSPNRPDFTPVVLYPGVHYQSTTIYRFSTEPRP